MYSLNLYSKNLDVLIETIKHEEMLNIKSAALILILKLKPMNVGQLKDFLIDDLDLTLDEAIELLEFSEDIASELEI
ncbi:hypothetical protein [uncultured Methanobrevibacter sp.]|uniref:hypothetical protein n=1 Tax=uncultured Methanobrevibacter sp. TaxID=253161 RepID=UPI0025E3BD75|nr:hypothetical protein [uncultured Methanobrevibacter sp.]